MVTNYGRGQRGTSASGSNFEPTGHPGYRGGGQDDIDFGDEEEGQNEEEEGQEEEDDDDGDSDDGETVLILIPYTKSKVLLV